MGAINELEDLRTSLTADVRARQRALEAKQHDLDAVTATIELLQRRQAEQHSNASVSITIVSPAKPAATLEPDPSWASLNLLQSVLRVLAEAPGLLTVSDVVAALRKVGFDHSSEAVRSAMGYARRKGEADWATRNQWYLVDGPNDPAQQVVDEHEGDAAPPSFTPTTEPSPADDATESSSPQALPVADEEVLPHSGPESGPEAEGVTHDTDAMNVGDGP